MARCLRSIDSLGVRRDAYSPLRVISVTGGSQDNRVEVVNNSTLKVDVTQYAGVFTGFLGLFAFINDASIPDHVRAKLVAKQYVYLLDTVEVGPSFWQQVSDRVLPAFAESSSAVTSSPFLDGGRMAIGVYSFETIQAALPVYKSVSHPTLSPASKLAVSHAERMLGGIGFTLGKTSTPPAANRSFIIQPVVVAGTPYIASMECVMQLDFARFAYDYNTGTAADAQLPPEYLPFTPPPVGVRPVRDELVAQLWVNDDPMQYAEGRFIDHGYPHTHIVTPAVSYLLQRLRPLFWLELGTMIGGSAIATAKAAKEFGLATTVVCVDPFTGDVNMWAWEAQLKPIGQWRFLRLERGAATIQRRFMANAVEAGQGDAIIPIQATSLVAMKLLLRLQTEGRLHFRPEVVYLDSAHEKDETFMELTLAWELLAPGGVLWGDDFNAIWVGVVHDVTKFVNTRYAELDPVAATAAFAELGSAEWTLDADVFLYHVASHTWLLFKRP